MAKVLKRNIKIPFEIIVLNLSVEKPLGKNQLMLVFFNFWISLPYFVSWRQEIYSDNVSKGIEVF
jgi:hypothetical protein